MHGYKTSVTEREASEKWCPFAGRGRDPERTEDLAPFRCIGSGCMAWCWGHGERESTNEPLGYCGLVVGGQLL
jgi:hypothetical protein